MSNDVVKERTAVRLVSYLAKLNKLSPGFALSIFGSVARNGQDEKLRNEAYIKVNETYRPIVSPILFADERKATSAKQ